MTKAQALKALGATTKRGDRWLSEAIDIATVKRGRCLIRDGEFFRCAVLAIDGEASIHTEAQSFSMSAPFVIDDWCCDERWKSAIEVVAVTPMTVALVTTDRRDAVFNRLTDLRELSTDTERRLRALLASEKLESDRSVRGVTSESFGPADPAQPTERAATGSGAAEGII